MAELSQVLLLVLGLLLILIVLLQRGRGGGLAGAFGGMGGQSAFGTRAGDVFTRITAGIAVAWVLLAGGSGWLIDRQANAVSESEYQSESEFGGMTAPEGEQPTGPGPLGEDDAGSLPSADSPAAGDAPATDTQPSGDAATETTNPDGEESQTNEPDSADATPGSTTEPSDEKEGDAASAARSEPASPEPETPASTDE